MRMRVVPLLSLSCSLLLGSTSCLALAHPRHVAHTNLHHAAASAHASLHHIAQHGRHGKVHEAPAVHHAAVRVMDADRASAIQTALIRQGYMTGEPTGSWDASSAAAMQKLQADNGWQTKIVPDSRALIKLGLGPQNDITVQ